LETLLLTRKKLICNFSCANSVQQTPTIVAGFVTPMATLLAFKSHRKKLFILLFSSFARALIIVLQRGLTKKRDLFLT
jgi:hypothetical protein